MATDPRTTARYPISSNVPNASQDIQNAVADLSDTAVVRYTTAAARDTSHTNWVAAGNTMDPGLMCTVSGDPQLYRGGQWTPTLPTFYRRVAATASGALNGGVNLCASQSVQTPFGTGVNYMVDVDVSVLVSIPANLGAKIEILVDGVVQDGSQFTNGGSTVCNYMLNARCGATFADNSSHSISALITSISGAITVFTTYGRMLMLARPYLTF